MAKLLPAKIANDLVFNIFTSSKSRTLFGIDFSTLNKAEKVQYLKDFLHRDCFRHQEDILDVLTDPYIKNTTTNVSRQGGKTEILICSQAINAIHNLYPALDGLTKVISLANKESQAMIGGNRLKRLLDENWDRTKFFYDLAGSVKTHLVFKKEAGLNTKMTGEITYLTANPRSFGEGFTGSILNIDEAGRLDPMVYSQVIIPYGGSTNAKINLTGVSRGRGPFYEACNSKDYTHLHYPWDKIDTYRRSAPVDLIDRFSNKIILKTGFFPLEVMPHSLKKVLYPTNPICHIHATNTQKERWVDLWELSEGIMSEEDFRSQYSLEWLAALMAILQLEHLTQLFETGDFAPLDRGEGEEYWYGFDLAGAVNVYGSGNNDKDTAALSVWRRRNGVKEKVFCDELYSAQPEDAVQWLTQYIHPQNGIFPCKYGAIDVTGSIGAFASEKLVAARLPVVPIIYNRTEETTKKNFKNAMFDYFKIEVGGGRARYPREEFTDALDPDTLKPLNPLWYKSREQWEVVERKITGGINAQINAPSGKHDDFPNSDCLCVYCMDRPFQFEEFLKEKKQRARFPVGGTSMMNRTGALAQFQQQTRPQINRLQ